MTIQLETESLNKYVCYTGMLANSTLEGRQAVSNILSCLRKL